MTRANKKIKILFVYYSFSSFVKKDLEILKKYFEVTPIQWRGKRDLLRIAFYTLKSDLTFSWFVSHYAGVAVFFSKLFMKKSIVIAGGGDVACVPEINYGQFSLEWHRKILPRFSLNYADKILIVDPSLKEDIIQNAKIDVENIDYLPTGYDLNFWKPKDKKEDIILSVAIANNLGRVKIKGLETMVKAAMYLSEKFILIGIEGIAKEYLEKFSPKNVEIIGFLSKKELLSYYQRSKVYCQLSFREGLPNTVCEAMLCKCVPVGTNVQGIQTAIGDVGFYVTYGDEKATAEAIKKALAASKEFGDKARARIARLFPEERRERRLVEMIKAILES